MDKISASDAKQSFGRALALAAQGPVAIERHGKIVAALVPPDWLERGSPTEARRRAREAQRQVERDRLIAHQRTGITLLSDAAARRALIAGARREVRRWSDQQLCSRDYIERWSAWLALPVVQLVDVMCSDADGWGVAMRQNSPFTLAGR